MATGTIEIKVEGAAAALEADRVKKSLKNVDTAAKETQGSVDGLNKVLEQTKKTTSGIQKGNAQAATGFANLSNQTKATNANLKILNDNVRLLVSQNDKLQVSLQQVVSGITNMSTGAQKASASTSRATASMRGFSSQMDLTHRSALSLNRVMMAFGQGLSLAYAIQTLTEFDHTMAAVAAISRAGGNELDALREKAKELGSLTIYTSGEAAEAMRFLAQSGFQVNEILSASGGVLALAQAGNMGIAETAEIAAKALRGFRLEATQMDDVADVMAAAIMQSTMNLRELGDAFKYVAPIASSLGVDMREAAGFIGVLSDAGVDATMAGTSLRRIFSELTNPTVKAAKLIKNLGLTMQDLDVSSLGLVEVMRRLIASGIDVGTAFALFGDRGAVAFTTLSQKIDIVEEKIGNLQNVTGRAAEMQKVMASSLFAVWKELTSAIEFFVIETSEVSGALTTIKMALHEMAGAIRSVVNNVETLTPVISILTALITVKLLSGVLTLGRMMSATFVSSGAAMLTSATSAEALNTAIKGMSVSAKVAAGSLGALRTVLSFLGGPVGIGVGVLTAAIMSMKLESTRAEQVLSKYADAVKLLEENSDGAAAAQKRIKEEIQGLSIAVLTQKMRKQADDISVIYQNIEKEMNKLTDTEYVVEESFGGVEELVQKPIKGMTEFKTTVTELFRELARTGDIDAFRQGLNQLSVQSEAMGLDVSKNIALFESWGGSLWYATEMMRRMNEESARQKTVTTLGGVDRTGGTTKLAELFSMEQIGSITEEIQKLDREIDILTNAPKNMQKVWTEVFKLLGDSAAGLSIDFATMTIAADGSVVSAINLGKNLQLIYDLINRLTVKQTLEDANKTNKSYGKSLKEVTKELDRLLMSDKEFQRMESERQLAEFEKSLGKTHPKVVQFREELEKAFAAGFSSVKEVAKIREEIDKMVKKSEMGDLGFALYELDEKFAKQKGIYEKDGKDITELVRAQENERNRIIRESKDKDLQTQMSFWNEYLSLVGAYGGEKYASAVKQIIQNQTEVFRAAKVDEVAIAEWAEMKKLEYSTQFQDGIARGMKKTLAIYTNEAALMESMWNTTVSSMEDTLADWIYSGELSFQSFVETVGKALAKLAVQMMVLKPLMTGLSGMNLGSFFGFANGGVFNRGSITPFASGGVVSSPTLFPMRSGAGLMGEAGPEAVMPLIKLPSGRLGVEATGGGSVVMQNQNIITFEGSVQQGSEQNGGENAFATLLTEKIYEGLDSFVDQKLVQAQRPGGVLYSRG